MREKAHKHLRMIFVLAYSLIFVVGRTWVVDINGDDLTPAEHVTLLVSVVDNRVTVPPVCISLVAFEDYSHAFPVMSVAF